MNETILVWPNNKKPPKVSPVAGYSIRPLTEPHDAWWLDIQEQAVSHYSAEQLAPYLERYRQLALPDGILIAMDNASQRPVATAGSLLSPRKDLFTNAGEIGWVATIPEQRNKGLAQWLCAQAVKRLSDHSVDTVFLTTGPDMPAAIRLYFRLGFIPYLYSSEQTQQWRQICQDNHLAFEPHLWAKP